MRCHYFDDLDEIIIGECVENGFHGLNSNGFLQTRHRTTGVDQNDHITRRRGGPNVPILNSTVEQIQFVGVTFGILPDVTRPHAIETCLAAEILPGEFGIVIVVVDEGLIEIVRPIGS